MGIVKLLKDIGQQTHKRIEVRLGNMEEMNFGLDKALEENILPLLFIVPFEVRDVPTSGGLLYSFIPFNAFMLDRDPTPKPTNEFDSEELELTVIEPMRLLARMYMTKVNSQSWVRDEKGNGIKEIVYTPTYAAFDAHVHGVAIRATIPIVEGLTGCQ